MTGVLDRRFYASLATDPENSFIIYMYIVISVQFVSYSSIAFCRIVEMYLFDDLCNVGISDFVVRNISIKPFVVCRSRYFAQTAKSCDRIPICLMFFFDRLIDMFISDQA